MNGKYVAVRDLRFDSYEEASNYKSERNLDNYSIVDTIDGKFRLYRHKQSDEESETKRVTGRVDTKMNSEETFSIVNYQKIAKQLCYPKEIIEKISDAKTHEEASRLLATGRHMI